MTSLDKLTFPAIWDMCTVMLYDKSAYAQMFFDILRRSSIDTSSDILDAGCGSGFPALDLVKLGYHVIATDKSSEMLHQLEYNAKKRGLTIDSHLVPWSQLEKRFGRNRFDFVYCRGNSLAWVASWKKDSIVPDHARSEIQEALRNFYLVLDSGHTLYVDASHEDETSDERTLGTVEIGHRKIQIAWRFDHDLQKKVRTWIMQLKCLETGEIKTFSSCCYLLAPGELANLLREAGFLQVERGTFAEEPNYDVYFARK